MHDKVSLSDEFNLFDDLWSPRIVGQVNKMHVKLAKVEGEFEWYYHDNTDGLFYVQDGKLPLELRDRADEWLEAGEFFIVPQGVEHRPVAPTEVELVLIESAGTGNTGNVESERITDEEWI